MSPQCTISMNAPLNVSSSPSALPVPQSIPAKPRQGSLQWVVNQLHRDLPLALKALRRWSNRQRRQELSTELVMELLSLSPDSQHSVLRELKNPKRWIRRIGQRSVLIPTLSTTLTDQRKFDVVSLLDCGATGCYLDEGFARAKGLFMEKLPCAIPVYNADGSFNAAGPIRYFTSLRVQINDHAEVVTFAVTNLGKSDMILGFDWLQKHNPTVNWRTGHLLFNHCPTTCSPHIFSSNNVPTEDAPPVSYSPEDDDRLWVTMIYEPDPYSHSSYIRTLHSAEQQLAQGSRKSLSDLLPDYCTPDFLPVFSKTEFDKLPDRRRWDHAIELKPNADHFNSKIYPLSRTEQAELDGFLEEHLRTGRIRPSKSPIASPFFFTKKKDGSLQPVQDYRKLNDLTIKNRYPLPLISEVVHQLRDARFFTKMDVRWGYNNIRLRDGDEWKAAFTTNRGLFEPLVMFFGLTNSPATFQTMMNDLFADLIRRGVVIVYMDDILVFTRTLQEHREVVREVLQILMDNKLCLKPEKCEFEKEEIEYLGMLIQRGRIVMDPKKVEAIAHWPVPQNKHDLQQFLGFVNFYRRFIRNYAQIASPLHRLTGLAPWSWSPKEQHAFESLKLAATSAPVLTIPADNAPYRVEADSSGYATGAVLSQLQPNGLWHPVAFLSKTLSEVERNYDIYD